MAELKQRMSSYEFSMWNAYLRIEPPMEFQLRYVGAQIASTIYNMFRGKGSKPGTVEEFLLKFESPMQKHDTSFGWKAIKCQLRTQFNKKRKEG